MTVVEIAIPQESNEQSRPMLWLVSWIVSDEGIEGDIIYSGTGPDRAAVRVPAGAKGMRVRRWPSDGLDPEYADVSPDALNAAGSIEVSTLPFYEPQPHSTLRRWRSNEGPGESGPEAATTAT